MEKHHEITYTTSSKAPVEKVWNALTNPVALKQYFFNTDLITNWAVGSDIVFEGEWEGKEYRDIGKVLEYQHEERLAYSYLSGWSGKEDKPENYLRVSYEVRPIDGGTEITVTQTNYDESAAEHTKKTWEFILEEMKKSIE